MLKMTLARWLASLMLFTAITPAAAATLDRSMQPIAHDPVATSTGRIAGTRLASGVKAYLGVPFAAPPTGDGRWAPPKPIHWSGVWNADRKGPACIQVLRPHDINHYFGEEATSEDCLTLNVWEPAAATTASKLPVIVFIYGGGFTVGSSGMANYDGEPMAKAGAVFVNFNYRVGAFGFLAHPALSAEQGGHSGNYGLLDQVAALQWVHDNIARFGGDPDRVLIMGQSAGAASVQDQMFDPLAKGLFRAAVMSSGCNLMRDGPTLADAEQTGLALQKLLRVDSLEALRNVPADRILASQSESQLGVHVEGVRITGPVVDGYVLPAKRTEMLARGQISRVPIIASYNAADISFGFEPLLGARTVSDYQAAAKLLWGDNAEAFLALYPAASDADVARVARQAVTEAGLESGARGCAMEQAKLGEPAYLDEFTRVHPYVPGVRIADQNTATVGAYHTADIPYWFGTLDAYNSLRPTRNWTPEDRALSERMMAALIAMARTGSPDTPLMPWPAWTPTRETRLVLDLGPSDARLDRRRLDWIAEHPPIPRAPKPRAPGVRD